METPTPGIYPDTPPEVYHAWDAASNSRLGKMMRSPAHLQAYLAEDQQDTKAFVIGRAVHCAVLEPERFPQDYARAPEGDKRTKAVKEAWAELEDDLADHVEILRADDYDACLAMRDAVHATKAKRILTRSDRTLAELSAVWDDERTGVRCKGRFDWHSLDLPGGVIVDLKTTRDASRLEFERSIFSFGYHRQAAMYLDGATALDLPAASFIIIAVEKDPPHGVGIYRLTEGAIQAGRDQVEALLERYAECRRTGEWPGYEDRIMEVSLPAWAWTKNDEQVEAVREAA